jgi:hypothetical protein
MYIYVDNNSIYIGGSYEIVVIYIVSLICLLSGPKQAVVMTLSSLLFFSVLWLCAGILCQDTGPEACF